MAINKRTHTCIPKTLLALYMCDKLHTNSLITVLSPGQRPTQVRMQAFTSSGPKINLQRLKYKDISVSLETSNVFP